MLKLHLELGEDKYGETTSMIGDSQLLTLKAGGVILTLMTDENRPASLF